MNPLSVGVAYSSNAALALNLGLESCLKNPSIKTHDLKHVPRISTDPNHATGIVLFFHSLDAEMNAFRVKNHAKRLQHAPNHFATTSIVATESLLFEKLLSETYFDIDLDPVGVFLVRTTYREVHAVRVEMTLAAMFGVENSFEPCGSVLPIKFINAGPSS